MAFHNKERREYFLPSFKNKCRRPNLPYSFHLASIKSDYEVCKKITTVTSSSESNESNRRDSQENMRAINFEGKPVY